MEKALRVTFNSDVPAYFPGYMTENLIATQQAADLSRDQIVQLSVNAFEGGWLPSEERDGYLAQLTRFASAHG